MRNFLQLDNRLIPFTSIGYIDLQHRREGGQGTCVRVWLNTEDLGTTVQLSNAMPHFLDYTGDPQVILQQLQQLTDAGESPRTATARG